MMRAAASLTALAAAHGAPNSADLRRAHQHRPYGDSHVSGATTDDAWQAISRHVQKGAAAARGCEEWQPADLHALLRRLLRNRDRRLTSVYAQKNDKRALHYDGDEYKAPLWAAELAQPPLSVAANVSREGNCAEALLLWTHHLSQSARDELAAEPDFKLPLMPAAGPRESKDKEYVFQIMCSTCHTCSPPGSKGSWQGDCPKGSDQPGWHLTGGSPQLRNNTPCPIDPATGKAHNFYNRTKRCDWDFDPPCQPCEAKGGYIWGDGEDDILYTNCEVVMKAEDIPKDNVTSPIWPKYFTMQAFNNQIDQLSNGGPFPGADPCSPTHHFENQYQQFYYYDGRDYKNPVAAATQQTNFIVPKFGADCPNAGDDVCGMNVTNRLWHLPNFDFWVETVKPDGSTLFCQCIGVPHIGKPFLGALRYDFAKDAVLIGREKIGLEASTTTSPPSSAYWRTILADHWNMGPHHFWVEVSTNLMLRGWQPFNALQVFYDWNLTLPEPEFFQVGKSCLDMFTANLSCPVGTPTPAPPPTLAPAA